MTDDSADFKTFDNADYCQSNGDINCQSIERIIVAMKYVQSLNLNLEESIAKQKFINFTEKVYSNSLNDKIHLIHVHGEQIEEIKEIMFHKYKLQQCNIKNCVHTSRHRSYNRREKAEHKNETDEIFLFNKRIFDSVHYYLYHLFDVGLRFSNKDQNDDDAKYSDQCFDTAFAKRKQSILDKKEQVQNIFDDVKSAPNKFVINTTEQSNDPSKSFLDGLFEFVSEHSVPGLYTYLVDEEYDTDSVQQDIEHIQYTEGHNSNIYKQLKNVQGMNHINKYVGTYRSKTTSFSTGFVFFYWPYYSQNEHSTEIPIWANDDDLAGFSVVDLYIAGAKFKDFQSEILNYYDFDENFTMDTYKNQIMLKANKYMSTNKIKGTTAREPGKVVHHYDIPPLSPIKTQHIMAVIIYCDFSKLCTTFSGTFRFKDPFEKLSEVKRRNKIFYHLSKYLREAVECYGKCCGHWDDTVSKDVLDEPGPFFCGMSVVMEMPSFSIRLNGPTSTTKQLPVAMNFSKHKGMIIQLNNKYDAGGYEQPLFDTSWISNFSDEDERLTMGGSYPLQIESIRHVETAKNFAVFMEPLFCFDAIISGLDLNFKWSGRHISILKSFIGDSNERKKRIKFDSYVLDTFQTFCFAKKSITFNMPLIDSYCPEKIKNLIFYSMKCEEDVGETVYADNGSNVNIPRLEILNMFPNLQKVVIYSVDERGKNTYQISLAQLLSKTNNMKCVITATWKDRKGKKDKKRSWLFYHYASMQIAKNVRSSLTYFIDYDKVYNDLLTIERIQ